ncbi:hypothetical protein ACIQXV_19100 [Neobacillus sp. NPDC097160]
MSLYHTGIGTTSQQDQAISKLSYFFIGIPPTWEGFPPNYDLIPPTVA